MGDSGDGIRRHARASALLFDSCSGLFTNQRVTLSAQTVNGSGSHFSGWSYSDCGAARDCRVDMTTSSTGTATRTLPYCAERQPER
jgi:hypothetical protein